MAAGLPEQCVCASTQPNRALSGLIVPETADQLLACAATMFERKECILRKLLSTILAATALTLLPYRATFAAQPKTVHTLPALFVTGYADYGRTATGTWARYGECAVDPRYIPLGSYVHIPGVGDCHAEDTGGGVIGWHVDVWRPTVAQCYAMTGYYRGAYWYRR